MIVAVADHAHQAVGRHLEQVGHHPCAAAVDHARAHHSRPQVAALRLSTRFSCSTRHSATATGLSGGVFVGRSGRPPEHPERRREMTNASRAPAMTVVRGRLAAANNTSRDLPLDGDAVPRVVKGGVDVAVLSVGGGAERFGLRQAAQDRTGAPWPPRARTFRCRARARSPRVRSDEDVEHGAADVTGGAGQEDPHEGLFTGTFNGHDVDR